MKDKLKHGFYRDYEEAKNITDADDRSGKLPPKYTSDTQHIHSTTMRVHTVRHSRGSHIVQRLFSSVVRVSGYLLVSIAISVLLTILFNAELRGKIIEIIRQILQS